MLFLLVRSQGRRANEGPGPVGGGGGGRRYKKPKKNMTPSSCPLESLYLSSCRFEKSFLASVCNSPTFEHTLWHLGIRFWDREQISSADLDQISRLVSLEKLMLAECQLSGPVLLAQPPGSHSEILLGPV